MWKSNEIMYVHVQMLKMQTDDNDDDDVTSNRCD